MSYCGSLWATAARPALLLSFHKALNDEPDTPGKEALMTRTPNATIGLATLCTFLLLTFAVPLSADQGKAKGHAKHAEKREEKEKVRFQGLDRDNNGVITRVEWRGNDASFANRDWNHDGVLSGDEMKPGAIRPAARRPVLNRTTAASTTPTPRGSGTDPDGPVFARLDANHDGVLTRAEWPDGRFSAVDFNHDGVLSPYEYGVGR
jgi:EF hand domain-containing protein